MAKQKRTVKYMFLKGSGDIEEFEVVWEGVVSLWIENKKRGRFPIMKTDVL